MALLSRVLAKMAAGPPQRVKLARLALVVVGVALCALLALVILVGSNMYAWRERGRVLDFELVNRRQPDDLGPPGSPARKELGLSIAVASDASGAQRPQYCVDKQAVLGLAELRVALAAHARQPGGTDVPVVIEASDDAQHGWVIAAIDCLRQLRFKNVRFKD